MKLRSGKTVSMASDETKQHVTVSHNLTHCKSGIEPFAGRINGELIQGVETFIDSIDNYLANKKISDPLEAFVEAKAHFNLSQGDLGDCTRSIFFRDCKSWEDLKGFLRATYGSGDQKDVVLGLCQVLRLHNRNGNSFVAQNAKINDGVIDFISNLGNSDWADVNGRRAISLENLGRLLQLSVGLLSLPDELVNSFDVNFSPTSTENDVMAQINKNVDKMTVSDSTILKGVSKDMTSVCTVSEPQISENRSDNSFQSSQRSMSNGGVVQKRVLKCFNCNLEGHVKGNCTVRYCSFHHSSSHNWRECRSLKSNNESSFSRNRSQSTNRCFRNQSVSRSDRGNRSGSQPSSSSRSNFRERQVKMGEG